MHNRDKRAHSAPGAVTLLRQLRGSRPWSVAAACTSTSEPHTALCSHCHRSERQDTARAAEVRVDELLLVCVRT